MRVFENDIVTVQRQTYTGGSSGTSSYSTIKTVKGFFKTFDGQMSALNDIQLAQGGNFSVKNDPDIRVGDRLIINGLSYDVKGVKTVGTGAGFTTIQFELGIKN